MNAIAAFLPITGVLPLEEKAFTAGLELRRFQEGMFWNWNLVPCFLLGYGVPGSRRPGVVEGNRTARIDGVMTCVIAFALSI